MVDETVGSMPIVQDNIKFNQAISQPTLTVVYFTASWCRNCKKVPQHFFTLTLKIYLLR